MRPTLFGALGEFESFSRSFIPHAFFARFPMKESVPQALDCGNYFIFCVINRLTKERIS
jgi:hypothetical protein